MFLFYQMSDTWHIFKLGIAKHFVHLKKGFYFQITLRNNNYLPISFVYSKTYDLLKYVHNIS